MFKQAIAINPDIPLSRYNFATYLKDQDRPEEAAQQYMKALALKPDMLEAQANLRQILKIPGLLLLDEVIEIYKSDPRPWLLAEMVHTIHYACAWDKIGDYEKILLEMIHEKREGISPFAVMRLPVTAEDLFSCAKI